MKLFKPFAVLFLILFSTPCFPQRKAFESYYLTRGDYPSPDASPSWGQGGREVQGIAHDDSYWYITATEKFYGINILNSIGNFFIDLAGYLNPLGILLGNLENYQNCYLWKIPVSEPLDQNFTNNSKVKQVMLLQFPKLSNAKTFEGYNHWGDVDYYFRDINKTGYLLVPSSSNNHKSFPSPAMVIFRASDLSLVGYGKLPGDGPNHKHNDIGWCAVDSAGYIFSSNDDPDTPKPDININGTSIFKYKVDWDSIKGGDNGDISKYIHFEESHILKGPLRRFSDGKTTTLLDLHNMQGGQFSSSNELLYISNGSGRCEKLFGAIGFGAGSDPNDGIHVIDTKTWTEIHRSTNHDREEANYFDYHYDAGCGFFEVDSHSAEGLTIWDLDNGKAPKIGGQLHVLVADVSAGPENKAGIEHFSGKLQVDQSQNKPSTLTNPISGNNQRPFFTLSDAFTFYPAWDGAQIVVKSGMYGDIGHYSKRVKISSSGGSAVIGSAHPEIHGVVLYEHEDFKGDYRYFDDDIPDLNNDKINFNDVISSLRLNNIKSVILYEDIDFRGASITIKSNTNDLDTRGWNDRISSLKIIR